jgi:polysaccharide chain length determinant protein (PEP-CTERM system associated)
LPEQDEHLDVTIDKLLRVAIRRRWWLLVPAFVIGMGACVAAMYLPNRYKSEATILVEHQRVPERYVTPNMNYDIRETLLVMTEAILSRTRLLQIIDEFGLYQDQRKRLAPQEVVDLMRPNITIEPMGKGTQSRDLDAFKISFTGADPRLAQAVTSRLTTLFIEENLRSREELSAGTTSFLGGQLETAAVELKRQGSRVRDFKMRYLGELPEQQQGNLEILTGLHMQLQNTMTALGRAREQQVYLESLLSQYQDLTPTAAPAPGTAGASPTETIRAELTRLKNQRADLLARYTDRYPDVVKLDEQIKQSEALLAAATKAAEAANGGAVKERSNSPDSAARDATTAQVKSQLEANRLEIQNAMADQKQIESRIADYQRRLNMTPVREQELADILRDYNLSKQNYDDLLNKKTQSELATSLERHQQGQQFRIIDPPSLPTKPSNPDHVQISLGGLLAGIAVGVALAFLAEVRDHSLRDEKELSRFFAFPLMVGLPMLMSKVEERRRSRAEVVEWFVGATLCLLVCATEFYVYRRG